MGRLTDYLLNNKQISKNSLADMLQAKEIRGYNPTLEDKTYEVFGMEPNLDRGNILPLPDDKGGLMAPQWLYDLAKMVTLPAHAMQGGSYTMGDVTDMAMVITPASIAGSLATPAKAGFTDIGMGKVTQNKKTSDLLKNRVRTVDDYKYLIESRLKKMGGKKTHQSKGKSISSYWDIDGNNIRISDHEIPINEKRFDKIASGEYTTSWNKEFNISDRWEDLGNIKNESELDNFIKNEIIENPDFSFTPKKRTVVTKAQMLKNAAQPLESVTIDESTARALNSRVFNKKLGKGTVIESGFKDGYPVDRIEFDNGIVKVLTRDETKRLKDEGWDKMTDGKSFDEIQKLRAELISKYKSK